MSDHFCLTCRFADWKRTEAGRLLRELARSIVPVAIAAWEGSDA